MKKSSQGSLNKHLDLSNQESLYLLIFAKRHWEPIKTAAMNCVCYKQRAAHSITTFFSIYWDEQVKHRSFQPCSHFGPSFLSHFHFCWEGKESVEPDLSTEPRRIQPWYYWSQTLTNKHAQHSPSFIQAMRGGFKKQNKTIMYSMWESINLGKLNHREIWMSTLEKNKALVIYQTGKGTIILLKIIPDYQCELLECANYLWQCTK